MEHAGMRQHAGSHTRQSYKPHRSRSRRELAIRIAITTAAAAAAAALALFAYALLQPKGDTGSVIYPQGNMTRQAAQAMLDEQTAKSRITVSLQPTPRLRDGRLYLNFTVVDDNNGWAERVEVMQGDTLIYKSGIVQPGYAVTWVDAPDAHEGHAVATVYAVDEEGKDHGNPVSVEVDIETDAS